eukprot:scaffold71206_cov38-Prasinocladus_malaysianus.AAC.1
MLTVNNSNNHNSNQANYIRHILLQRNCCQTNDRSKGGEMHNSMYILILSTSTTSSDISMPEMATDLSLGVLTAEGFDLVPTETHNGLQTLHWIASNIGRTLEGGA